MIRVGVVGYGYWGPNLVRNFSETPGATVAAVCDLNAERLGRVKVRHPGVRVMSGFDELLSDKSIDAVVIATPVRTHFDLAMQALRNGKHVLVEKPLVDSSARAKRLIDEARKRRRILMVDHTFVYTGAVRKIRELVTSRELGRLYYYDSVRINLGLFQHDVNVLWDLAVHDLAIMDYVLGESPTTVSATGLAHVKGRPENIAYLTCYFENGLIAHFHVNWLAPVKIRQTLIGGDKKMIVYDDLEPDEKIRVYDRGVEITKQNVYDVLVSYRTGDAWLPKLDRTEALSVEAAHFIECIAKNKQPLTGGDAGLRVVRILEAANRSLAGKGRPVKV